MDKITVEDMAAFCKKKGFVYPTAEIYGGLSGFWDFGPLGVELKNNIKKEWWAAHVYQRTDITGIDGSIITNPKVWEASGHVSCFVDLFVVCKRCKYKTKIDKHEAGKVKCDKCSGEYENKGEFNPMFTTFVGPNKDDSVQTYLRPETAQLIFADFKLVTENARLKLPFGIAQVGKSFRNEVAPRDFLFRCREFEQMEIEYFVNPKEKCPYKLGDTLVLVYSNEMQDKKKRPEKMKFKDALKKGIIKTDWHAYWLEQHYLWFINLGCDPKKFRIRQHLKEEKSHYASDTWDLEYEFPFGWKELEGMANRGNYDLVQHEKTSKKDLKLFDEKAGKILPNVVCEPSLGVERAFLVFMFDAYDYNMKRENVVLKLNPRLAPIKVGIFPLVNKLNDDAQKVYDILKMHFNCSFDTSGSIGKRYARMDEAGTPFCIAFDFDSLNDKKVTVRDRDTGKQVRVKIVDLRNILYSLINEGKKISDFGKEF